MYICYGPIYTIYNALTLTLASNEKGNQYCDSQFDVSWSAHLSIYSTTRPWPKTGVQVLRKYGSYYIYVANSLPAINSGVMFT